MNTPSPAPQFDEFAADYDAALNKGIRLSGESKDYFIHRRVAWLGKQLDRLGPAPQRESILDFGCGTGDTFPFLRQILGARRIVGIDVSTSELQIAQQRFPWAQTFTPDSAPADLAADIAYSNGTFHHIPPPQRDQATALIFRSLKPGGIFALWENNPWNPGTRWVMSRIPFDRDAITLSPPETRRLLRRAGFTILRTDYLFIFPRFLAPLRALEPLLCHVPAGAQYQILCRRP